MHEASSGVTPLHDSHAGDPARTARVAKDMPFLVVVATATDVSAELSVG